MTLKDFYAAVGGDYDGVVMRLYSEQIVKKFLLKFLDDNTYNTLTEALAAKNYQDAFRAAHTIKGVCQNLGLNKLLMSSSALTEALRNGKNDSCDSLYEQVKADYAVTVIYLKELQNS